MSIPVQSASVYSDLQSLDRLKHAADQDSEQTLRFVAQQFEAMFMQMMLKSSHEFDEQDGLFDNEQTEFYQDWHDKQLAIHLSSGKGIGIADMLVEQLRRQSGNVVQEAPLTANHTPALDQGNDQANDESASTVAAQDIGKVEFDDSIDSPHDFVTQLYPLAEKAADRLGVSPEVLLAQAALETGWGQKVSAGSQGESSHNLFNIKADQRWNGARVQVPTVEYRDGIAVQQMAQFRAYDSYQASFDDYVDFIQGSPRYQEALALAADNQAYSQALARAGYATDPDYASKVMNIVENADLKNAITTIKL